jgi:hypothetical protein
LGDLAFANILDPGKIPGNSSHINECVKEIVINNDIEVKTLNVLVNLKCQYYRN